MSMPRVLDHVRAAMTSCDPRQALNLPKSCQQVPNRFLAKVLAPAGARIIEGRKRGFFLSCGGVFLASLKLIAGGYVMKDAAGQPSLVSRPRDEADTDTAKVLTMDEARNECCCRAISTRVKACESRAELCWRQSPDAGAYRPNLAFRGRTGGAEKLFCVRAQYPGLHIKRSYS